MKRVLFIGNSATYRNDIPQMLCGLANRAGFSLEVASVTKRGATLAEHADFETEHGDSVLRAITDGAYHVVFLQAHSKCIATEERRAATVDASKRLDAVIREAGSETCFYVRPPCGKDVAGYDSYTQCVEYDKLFSKIAQETGAKNAYVNRAFGYVIKNDPTVSLWGADHAHTSPEGAYLAACVFFSTVFGTTSTVLDSNGLPQELARFLQEAADKVVLKSFAL